MSSLATLVSRAFLIASMKRAPNPTRSQVTTPGWKASRPIAMKRNEPPQITPTETNLAQSRAVKASRFVPWVVESSRLLIWLEHLASDLGCCESATSRPPGLVHALVADFRQSSALGSRVIRLSTASLGSSPS